MPGIALGLAASRAANGVVARLSRDVPPSDTLAYAMGALALGVVAVFASAWTARRAASLDAAQTLRGE